MRDRRGMAMIFDALVFLTIIAIVSTALMSAFLVDSGGVGTDSYIDEVNEVSLSCTFEGEGLSSLMTVKEAIVQAIVEKDEKMLSMADEQLTGILRAYLSPAFIFYLSIIVGDSVHSIGDEKVLDREYVFASTIKASGFGGTNVKFTLSVSYA